MEKEQMALREWCEKDQNWCNLHVFLPSMIHINLLKKPIWVWWWTEPVTRDTSVQPVNEPVQRDTSVQRGAGLNLYQRDTSVQPVVDWTWTMRHFCTACKWGQPWDGLHCLRVRRHSIPEWRERLKLWITNQATCPWMINICSSVCNVEKIINLRAASALSHRGQIWNPSCIFAGIVYVPDFKLWFIVHCLAPTAHWFIRV